MLTPEQRRQLLAASQATFILVICYGCGATYDPGVAEQQHRHTHHLGDAGLDRAALLGALEEAQRDRDEWVIAFADR